MTVIIVSLDILIFNLNVAVLLVPLIIMLLIWKGMGVLLCTAEVLICSHIYIQNTLKFTINHRLMLKIYIFEIKNSIYTGSCQNWRLGLFYLLMILNII